jgi:hypothetical protein
MVLSLPESSRAWPDETHPYMIKCMKRPDSTAPDPAQNAAAPVAHAPATSQPSAAQSPKRPREIGGPSGLEPTRYGDWERNGRVSDF